MPEDDNIILFPGFDDLKSEVEKLRIELSMLMLERDELQFVICKNIETEYMMKLGGLEYRVYETMCVALRLKRMTELIQAKKNRQEKVIISHIELILDDEFASYQKTLDDLTDRMNEAISRNNAERLSVDENKELKKLYRAIVKALHPDINPNASEAQIQLFNNAVTAYKNGDLATLRIISEMIGGDTLSGQHEDAMAQLVRERVRLREMLKSVRESIDKIKSEYPYTLKEILDDPKRVEQKRLELEELLKQYEKMIDYYKVKIEKMLE